MVKVACLESRRSWVRMPLWYIVSKKQNVSSWLTRKDSILCGASVTEKKRDQPRPPGSNFKSCAWRAVSSHHPQEVFLTQFSLYVHKDGLRPHSVHIWHGLPDIGHINVDYGRWSRHSSRSKFITPKGTSTRRPTLFPRSAPETNRCQISGKFKLNMAYGPPFNRSKFINLKRHIYTDKGMCVWNMKDILPCVSEICS